MIAGTPSGKPEYRALLPLGRHEMTLAELRQLCVDHFPLSVTRPAIMGGLERVAEKLRLEVVEGEVWVDGSFLTEKANPEDVDIVVRCSGQFYEAATPEQKNAVDWLLSDLKNTYLCDSYFFFEWPEGHANRWLGEYMHSYWMRQFGFSRGNEMKGIAVIVLPGGIR